jgi:hypothetical protein
MQPEKIKDFKRLYVIVEKVVNDIDTHFATHQTDEKMVDEFIVNCNSLIAMLPMEFPTKEASSPENRILLVNLADPEDEPQQIVEEEHGLSRYSIPENAHMLYESTILSTLENWRFVMWNYAIHRTEDPRLREKYIPLMLAQAYHCMTLYPHGSYWANWEKERYVLYANQIGWFAYEQEQDTEKLEAALAELEKGYALSDWRDLNYIKDSKVRLLLKLNRPLEAYPIIREAFSKDENFEYFQDFKNDKTYLSWQKGAEESDNAAYQAFLERIKTEQEQVFNQFVNPQHPLVMKYTDALNLVKQRMVSFKLRQMYKDDWVTIEEDWDEEAYMLERWSAGQVAQFEKDNNLRLPDELKVYLMEIGEGGEGYFCYDGIEVKWLAENNEELEKVQKSFPIRQDEVHDICHWYGVHAWVNPDDEDWKEVGIFDEEDDLDEMFGLPPGAMMDDGCFEFGYASSQDPLLLVMNGEFEGEVWVDTLQYGAEAGGCFAPASADRLKFLAFIAESILAHEQYYSGAMNQGTWM